MYGMTTLAPSVNGFYIFVGFLYGVWLVERTG